MNHLATKARALNCYAAFQVRDKDREAMWYGAKGLGSGNLRLQFEPSSASKLLNISVSELRYSESEDGTNACP